MPGGFEQSVDSRACADEARGGARPQKDSIVTTRQPRDEADVPENFYPQDGAIYRHWKGGLYRVLMVARVEATQDRVVVYAPFAGGMAWTRPIREFGARFSYVNNLGVDPREGLADRRVESRGATTVYQNIDRGYALNRRTGSQDRRGGR